MWRFCFAFDGMQLVGFDTLWSFGAGFARVAFPFAAGVAIFRFGLYRGSRVPLWLPLNAFSLLLLFPMGSQALTDAVIAVIASAAEMRLYDDPLRKLLTVSTGGSTSLLR